MKVQPPLEAPVASKHGRESRIENLPLTIPGIVTLERTEGIRSEDNVNNRDNLIIEDKNTTVERNLTEKSSDIALSDSDFILPESSDVSEVTALPESGFIPEKSITQSETRKTEEPLVSEQEKALIDQNIPDKLQGDQGLPEQPEASQNLPEQPKSDDYLPEKSDELIEAHSSDTIPAETSQSERQGRNYESSETTDIFEEQTDRYEDVTLSTEAPRTKPKFISKLSYFKPQVFSFSKNSLEKATKRKFRSHCRCEKIWNCPKLQISVHRCPNEYFLCCF